MRFRAILVLLTASTAACTSEGPTSPLAAPSEPDPPSVSAGDVGIQSHPTLSTVTSSAFAGTRDATEGAFTPSIATLPGGSLSGEVVHVGRGCPAGSIDGVNPADPYLADPSGKIALIERGGCRFDHKIARAQMAGATGVIVFNFDSPLGETLVTMGGLNPTVMPDGSTVPLTTPAVFVQRSTGLLLRDGTAPVTVTITAPPPPTPEQLLAHVYEKVDEIAATGSLTQGQVQSLRAQLDAAARQIARGNLKAAANALDAFLNHVASYEASGVLTTAQADALRALAAAVLGAAGNGS